MVSVFVSVAVTALGLTFLKLRNHSAIKCQAVVCVCACVGACVVLCSCLWFVLSWPYHLKANSAGHLDEFVSMCG